MTHSDYVKSMNMLADEDLTFETLIMCAIRRGHSGQIEDIEKAFPDIYKEFHYRYWTAGGYMPGESGYDAQFDDNLPTRRNHRSRR